MLYELYFITFDDNTHSNHMLDGDNLCCLQHGRHLVHFACMGGNLDIVTRAVGLGLDVNSADKVCWYFTSEIFFPCCIHVCMYPS